MKHPYPNGSARMLLIAAFLLIAPFAHYSIAQKPSQTEAKTVSELRAEFGDGVTIRYNKATNKASFVRLKADLAGRLNKGAAGASPSEKAADFFKSRGSIFGVRDFERELTETKPFTDNLGETHISYSQSYKGVPVFGGILRTHFDHSGELRSVNGLFVPDIELNPTPGIKPDRASEAALAEVTEQNAQARGLRVQKVDLLVFRKGLLQGTSGKTHLAYRMEVTNGDVREFVFVDAHNGKIVEQITGKHKAMDRRLFNGFGVDAFPPASFPLAPFWAEGNVFPTGNLMADEILRSKKETYDVYMKAFGRDSFDGAGGAMNSFFNFNFFGNAFAQFVLDPDTSEYVPITGYGDDTISDDIVAHEWTHIYTAYTDGLIYAWQPGALNEAYSDIFGEAVDLLNSRGLVSPETNRTPNGEYCSFSSRPVPVLTVNSPTGIAGTYEAAFSWFGPGATAAGITSQVVRVNDGYRDPSDACTGPLLNASEINGKIALVEVSLTDCYVVTSVQNAQAAGAIGVILVNPAEYGDGRLPYGTVPGETAGITSIGVGHTLGNAIKAQLSSGVNATLHIDPSRYADQSFRWLLGEDTTYDGERDAIRDMYRPKCYLNPGKTSDDEYMCLAIDNGGVHMNSGIPNHTFSLLVDGGTYNGRTIQALGLTKALHIYYRAMSVYMHPYSDFADHADALEASADDLKSKNLNDLRTGLPSGIKIKNADLDTVHSAILATELRDDPVQCGFLRVVGNDPPDDSCNSRDTKQKVLLSEDFEKNPVSKWSVSREVGSDATFEAGNWVWDHDLPDRREGSGFFARNAAAACDLPQPGQVGVMELTSPAVEIPNGMAGGPHVSFDQWVATETGYDGAQVMISVNGGPFQPVEQSSFIYSGYNSPLLGPDFSDNPRAGQRAFTGVDGGSLDGSWGTSIIDLSAYAHGGDSIRLRFDLSSDYCFGTGLGWYLDNVKVYACDRRGR